MTYYRLSIPGKGDPDFDEYVAAEMAKNAANKQGSKRGNVGSDRFANSRLKPPGWNKPRNIRPPSGDENKDKFKNTGTMLHVIYHYLSEYRDLNIH